MLLHSAAAASALYALGGRLASSPQLASNLAKRAFAATPDTKISVEVAPYATHKIEPPSQTVETTVGELSVMHALMYKMRRMEVAADIQYKSKLIRGFCHLYDGQEAVLMGIEAAITKKDSLITTYRDHCHNLTRGGSVYDTMAELFGRATGTTRGIGGSMHMYNKAEKYYGGNGIVGSSIPNGAGIAFAHKYRKEPHVCVTMYGDGAANQGQKYEALNLAAIWDVPCIFVCENNHYGMGTAEWRAAKSSQFYTRGDYIPGIKADGMDVIAVKQVTQFAKQYALENGPIILEMDTYRYHGHSMSDPGSTYRTRDEINTMRQHRDPIERVKKLLLEAGVPSEDIKKTERDVKKEVDDAIAEAKKAPAPPVSWLWRNVYVNPNNSTLRDVGGGYVTPVYDPSYADLKHIA